MRSYDMPRRANPCAPHWLIPTPWPQPRPVITKAGAPTLATGDCRGLRASGVADAIPVRRAPQTTPAVRANARDIGVGPWFPRETDLRLAHPPLDKRFPYRDFTEQC